MFFCACIRLLGIAALVLATTTRVLAGFLFGITALAMRLATALHGTAGFAVFAAIPTLATGSGKSRRSQCGKTGCHEKEGRTFH
jgi:hypothetical protein